MKGYKNLSRRERQIMDIIYELGEASAAQVLDKLPNPLIFCSASLAQDLGREGTSLPQTGWATLHVHPYNLTQDRQGQCPQTSSSDFF
jgi:hypothetical protein